MTDHEIRRPRPSGQGLAAGYVLGALFVVLLVLMWARGLGRFLLPLLLVGAVWLVVRKVVHKIREPV